MTEDVYEFNPDGSKSVRRKIYARNVAAGVFIGGIATVAQQARIRTTEAQLTVYHLTYGPDGTVRSVSKAVEGSSNPAQDQPPTAR